MPDLSTFTQPGPYHIISYGTLLGSSLFNSFVGGIVAYKVLPRPSFAQLQAHLFPVYFGIQTALPAVIAITYPGSGVATAGLSGVFAETNRWSVLVPLATSFFTGLANLVVIGPETTKVMRERKHQETKDGKKSFDPGPHSPEMQELNKRFGIVHGLSTITNLVAIVAMLYYGGTLADMLR